SACPRMHRWSTQRGRREAIRATARRISRPAGNSARTRTGRGRGRGRGTARAASWEDPAGVRALRATPDRLLATTAGDQRERKEERAEAARAARQRGATMGLVERALDRSAAAEPATLI